MGKKYIIELNDECDSEFKGIMVFGLSQEKQISVELISEESMTHYTEDAAYAHGYTEAESKYREIRDELEKQAYQRGLADAWNAAKKIALMDTETSENVTGYFGLFRIMNNLTASEAIEKIRQYEQTKEDKNFDEVKDVLEETVKACNVTLDEIATVLQKMKDDADG